jgi:hypothetical protein
LEAEQVLADVYRGWCRSAHHFAEDCLGGALVAGKYLDQRGRYMWAMALSKSPVLEEFEKALGDMASMRAVIQAAMSTIVVLPLAVRGGRGAVGDGDGRGLPLARQGGNAAE